MAHTATLGVKQGLAIHGGGGGRISQGETRAITHFALVEVAHDLLEEPLLKLLLAPDMGAVTGDEVRSAGLVGPLGGRNTAHAP